MNLKERSHALIRKSPKILRNFIILLIFLGIIGLLFVYIQNYLGSPREAAEKIRSMGVLGPLAVIFLIIMEVVFAPIPGYIVPIASGYAFGGLWGTVYSYVGNIIGTGIAFFIARRFGRPFVEKIVNKAKLNHYDCFFRERGKVIFWIVYLFPIFPADIVSFMAGLTDLKWKDFMLIVVIAYLPNMLLLNSFGATLFESGFGNETLLFGGLLLFVVLFGSMVYLFLRKKTVKKC